MQKFQWQKLGEFARKETGALIGLQQNDWVWQFPLAAAAACGMPMVVGALLELPRFGALGAVAGLSFLYTPPVGSRHAMAIVLAAALVMTASYALGLIGSAAPTAAPILIGCVAAAGCRFCQFNRLAPPGPLFMVMAAAIGAFSPVDASTAAPSLGQFIIGCIWSCAISAIYLAVVLRRPQQETPPAAPRIASRAASPILTGVFAGSSVAAAAMLALPKPYWAAVTCAAVMQGTTLRASLSRNIHRIVGTVIGLGLTGLLAPILTTSWSIAAAVACLTFLVEATIIRHYAFAAVFFTPLAILLAEGSNTIAMGTGALMQARLIDTIVGAVLGLIGAICIHYCQRGRAGGGWPGGNAAGEAGCPDATALHRQRPRFRAAEETCRSRPCRSDACRLSWRCSPARLRPSSHAFRLHTCSSGRYASIYEIAFEGYESSSNFAWSKQGCLEAWVDRGNVRIPRLDGGPRDRIPKHGSSLWHLMSGSTKES